MVIDPDQLNYLDRDRTAVAVRTTGHGAAQAIPGWQVTVMNVRIPHGMQEVRGSTPRSSTGQTYNSNPFEPLYSSKVQQQDPSNATPAKDLLLRIAVALLVGSGRENYVTSKNAASCLA
jgi:hypothetical protein